MSCGVVRRFGLDPVLLWLWHRLAATAPIQPLTWEFPYAVGAALKKKKKEICILVTQISYIYLAFVCSSWLKALETLGKFPEASEQRKYLLFYCLVPCPEFLKSLQSRKGEVGVLLFFTDPSPTPGVLFRADFGKPPGNLRMGWLPREPPCG